MDREAFLKGQWWLVIPYWVRKGPNNQVQKTCWYIYVASSTTTKDSINICVYVYICIYMYIRDDFFGQEAEHQMFVAEDVTAKLCAHIAAIQHPEATTPKRRKILFETFPTPQNGGKSAMLAFWVRRLNRLCIYIYICNYIYIIYIISMAILNNWLPSGSSQRW